MATKTTPKPKSADLGPAPSHDVVLDIPLQSLHPADDNPRSTLGDLAGLAESIGSIHILEPLIVVKRAAGGWTIVAGHRRRAAAEIAGLVVAPCIVREFAEVDRLEAMAIENMQREDLTPLEAARSFQLLVDAGLSQRDIADRCGVSQALVSKRLSLLKLPDTIQVLVTAGKVAIHDAETIAQAKPEALAIISTPEYIKANHGSVRPYDVSRAQEQVDDERARTKAIKSGLPEYNQPRDGHDYDYGCDRDVATHFKISRGKTVWIKVRKTKRGAGGPTPSQKAAERAKAERHAERRRFAGAHLAKLNDCALRVSLVANYHAMLRTDGDDARVVLDWLGTRSQLAKDTKGLAVTAWKALRTPSSIATKPQRLFTMGVIANVEASFEGGWRGREAQGIYLATLNQLGWELDDTETKLAAEWLEQLSVDSQGIIQPTDEPKDIRTEAGQMWVEPELQPADDVPPSASCSSCSRPATTHDGFDNPLCNACAEELWAKVNAEEPILGGNLSDAGPDGVQPTESCCISCHRPESVCGERSGYGVCDDCSWSASATDPTPDASVEPSAAEAYEASMVRIQLDLANRLAGMPDDQQAWIAAHPEATTGAPWAFFETMSIDAIRAEIASLNDIEELRHAACFELHRSGVSRRDPVVLAALIRIRDIEPDPIEEPDDNDIRHAALNRGNRPMLDDEGEPVFCDPQDEIAANEAAGRIVPDKPWASYASSSEERLLKTISTTVKPASLERAIAYELAVDNRDRILEALRLRLAVITKAA